MSKKKKSSPNPPPKPVHDPVLGEVVHSFHVNPKLDEYSARVSIGKVQVGLLLYSDDNLDISVTINHAKDRLKRHANVIKQLKTYVAETFLSQLNEVWRQDEPLLKASEFWKTAALIEIIVHADGRSTYEFNTGDLMDGHTLRLFLDSDGRINDHDTPG